MRQVERLRATPRGVRREINHQDLWRSDPVYRQFITGAIRWVLGLEK